MLKRMFGTLLISCMLLIGVAGASLVDNPPSQPDPAKMEAQMKQTLHEMVASKVITPKQETAIIEYFKKNTPKKPEGNPSQPPAGKPSGERPSMFSQLVKDGVITAEQAKAIEDKMPKPPAPKSN